jgi:hypothetical protein
MDNIHETQDKPLSRNEKKRLTKLVRTNPNKFGDISHLLTDEDLEELYPIQAQPPAPPPAPQQHLSNKQRKALVKLEDTVPGILSFPIHKHKRQPIANRRYGAPGSSRHGGKSRKVRRGRRGRKTRKHTT